MHRLTSEARLASPEFHANEAAQLAAVRGLRARLAATAQGGSPASRERAISRGPLLPRDRIDHLIDRGSPFLEVAPLAANGMYDDEV
ncbi:MAG: methylcrotonoyl-CoA carboxylase, partial [Candidatus Saccharibacteria bacterium]|nr:methylcrotonoyl-CoA carboxylase [Microbacteriaceae bacterium]